MLSKSSLPNSSNRGFTLSEILITLAILAICLALAIPGLVQQRNREARYTKAMETLLILQEITTNYLNNEGDDCFPTSLTCNFDPTTGFALDGKATGVSLQTAPDSYNRFVTYLDSHLNYVQKTQCTYGGPYVCYYLPTGVTVVLTGISVTVQQVFPNKFELAVWFSIYLDETPVAASNFSQYSTGGVDADFAQVFIFRDSTTIAGQHAWYQKRKLPYDPRYHNIFDLKSYPNQTCATVGGLNCSQ